MSTLASEYGYVLLAASGSFLINFWQMMMIRRKRLEFDVKVGFLHPSLRVRSVMRGMKFYNVFLFSTPLCGLTNIPSSTATKGLTKTPSKDSPSSWLWS